LANNAFEEFSQMSDITRSEFLLRIADLLQLHKEKIGEIYCAESGLTKERFEVEMLRTVSQLINFSNELVSGAWRNASIDTAYVNQQPAKPDLRKFSVPLGPVVVFGASNFPLAYSTIGGDTAAALAAGCPVIVKAHALHAATSDLVASYVVQAAQVTGMPNGVFSHLHAHSFRVGQELAQHPLVKAVGFTGSHAGGRALFDLANARKEPIPVFAEMGSVNPVFVFPELLNDKNKRKQYAEMLANSMISGMGQFCTNPGLIFVFDNEDSAEFIDLLCDKFLNKETTSMLHASIKERFDQGKVKMAHQGVDLKPSIQALENQPVNQTLGVIKGSQFIQNSELQEEVFGPFTLVVRCADLDEMKDCCKVLKGQLTATVIALNSEFKAQEKLLFQLKNKVGRVIFNGVPTGVDISPSMHHGGPYPATTDSRFSAVGIDAIQRFLRPVTYQDCPDEFLPIELKNHNISHILRRVNNVWTTDDVIF
jgi:NADP-dependent aldehyde dehydrogenase